MWSFVAAVIFISFGRHCDRLVTNQAGSLRKGLRGDFPASAPARKSVYIADCAETPVYFCAPKNRVSNDY
jgi:hypothetical protein